MTILSKQYQTFGEYIGSKLPDFQMADEDPTIHGFDAHYLGESTRGYQVASCKAYLPGLWYALSARAYRDLKRKQVLLVLECPKRPSPETDQ